MPREATELRSSGKGEGLHEQIFKNRIIGRCSICDGFCRNGNADAAPRGRNCMNMHNGLATLRCDLVRNGNLADANTNATAVGQVRTHVFFMRQPNGVAVTGGDANVDSGWVTGIPGVGVSRIANNGSAGRNQQIQARHWFRLSASHSAYMTYTIRN